MVSILPITVKNDVNYIVYCPPMQKVFTDKTRYSSSEFFFTMIQTELGFGRSEETGLIRKNLSHLSNLLTNNLQKT